MEQLTKERIKIIEGWKRKFSYRKDSMSYRILKFLKEHGISKYSDISCNERFNYTRNLNIMKNRLHHLRISLEYHQKDVNQYKDDFPIPESGHNDVRLAEMTLKDHTFLTWDVYKYSEKDKPEEDLEGRRWLSLKEHQDYKNQVLLETISSIEELKAQIKDIEKNPGVFFEGNRPGEPGYSQYFSVMMLDGTIEKVKRGYYQITQKGLEKLSS